MPPPDRQVVVPVRKGRCLQEGLVPPIQSRQSKQLSCRQVTALPNRVGILLGQLWILLLGPLAD